ncbi:MAG: hypothetical protein EBV05_14030, partial [Cyanobacteria bacterium WB6_1B_304]|nr:hypothetical protein [Cyanobacteria bacterium WB6_1B_304]
FTIFDGVNPNNKPTSTKTYGPFKVSRLLSVKVAHYDSDVVVDVNGLDYSGSVLMDLGLGDRDPTTDHPVGVIDKNSTPDGSVRGNVTIVNGSGSEKYRIGAPTGAGTVTQMTIGGNVSITGRNNASDNADTFNVASGIKIGGSLSSSFVDFVDVGDSTSPGITTVGGSVSYTNAGSRNEATFNIYATINGNVSMTGTAQNDIFLLSKSGPNVGIVRGNINVNLGMSFDGGNHGQSAAIDPGSIVGGNVSINSTGGALTTPFQSLYVIDGKIGNNLTCVLGEGNNFCLIGSDATTIINGNVVVTAGNGPNQILFSDGIIAGNLSVSVGNGSNTTTLTIAPQGRFTYRGGNGSQGALSELLLNSLVPVTYNVDILFGLSGSHTLEYSSAGSFLTGRVRSGTSSSTFSQTSGDLLPTFSIDF